MADVMFAGPTLADLPDPALVARCGVDLRAPAQRGDIHELVAEQAPGVIILVDGRFHHVLAVGHAELRGALCAGWSVWGLGSLGAIRAFEMRRFGMRGYGRVYAHFLAEEDFQDDEVALLHAPEHPYQALSEPLVHLRHFMAHLESVGSLERDAAWTIARDLKQRWYGERTARLLIELVRRYCGEAVEQQVEARLDALAQCRVKATDLMDFLTQTPWRTGAAEPMPELAPYSEAIYGDGRDGP